MTANRSGYRAAPVWKRRQWRCKSAKKRFGEPLHVTGDTTFRDMMIAAAVEGKVFVKFADSGTEKQRKQLLYSSKKPNHTAKEKEHAR